MNDPTDHRLRALAQALVTDRSASPDLDGAAATSYLDSRSSGPGARSRVLVSVAAATLVVAGGIALAQGRSAVAPGAVEAASAPLVAVTPTPRAAIDPALLLDRPYELRRGSVDDPTQNRIVPLGVGEVPPGLLTELDAIAAAPSALAPPAMCPSMAEPPGCDPAFSTARLARYQGFGGYTSEEDIDGPGGGDVRHDTIVWVVVRGGSDFELAYDPGHLPLITALLIDATSGELVSGGELLPPA